MKIVCLTGIFKEVEYMEIYSTDDDFHFFKEENTIIYVCDLDFPEHVIGLYPKKYFLSLSEWREQQINEILE